MPLDFVGWTLQQRKSTYSSVRIEFILLDLREVRFCKITCHCRYLVTMIPLQLPAAILIKL
jgi:hypothetical protein